MPGAAIRCLALYDKAQGRYDTHGNARDTTRQGPVLRYKVCIVTGGPTTWQRARATRSEGSHDMAPRSPRHGSQRTACAQPRRSAHAAGVQPGFFGCAPYELDPVLTQCTILSHCLDHCFMNTIHGNCSRGFQKMK